MNTAIEKAKRSLEGLSVGDAFGQLFFQLSPYRITPSGLPQGPWRWTDDTHMAMSIVEILATYGRIEQDALARAFAGRYAKEPFRGYGGGARRLLEQIAEEGLARIVARLFGARSYGNGAAMRVAPVGAISRRT